MDIEAACQHHDEEDGHHDHTAEEVVDDHAGEDKDDHSDEDDHDHDHSDEEDHDHSDEDDRDHSDEVKAMDSPSSAPIHGVVAAALAIAAGSMIIA